mmetsp:Transcript_45354/g.126157  ORF Transcript_45354/g.126157 Transcript_45354/m.126157 type:complete len:234 (-) Transcript_45354:1436-2137(-)
MLRLAGHTAIIDRRGHARARDCWYEELPITRPVALFQFVIVLDEVHLTVRIPCDQSWASMAVVVVRIWAVGEGSPQSTIRVTVFYCSVAPIAKRKKAFDPLGTIGTHLQGARPHYNHGCHAHLVRETLAVLENPVVGIAVDALQDEVVARHKLTVEVHVGMCLVPGCHLSQWLQLPAVTDNSELRSNPMVVHVEAEMSYRRCSLQSPGAVRWAPRSDHRLPGPSRNGDVRRCH